VNSAKAQGREVLTTTSAGDAQKQLNDINDFIAQKGSAVVAVQDDSADVCHTVKAAKEAHIPFFTIDRPPSGCDISMTVLSNDYFASQQSGETNVAFLKQRYGSPKDRVLKITGNLAQNVAQLRGDAFEDMMKKYPDIKVITKVGDWNSTNGVNIARDVGSAESDLDEIYVHSDSVYSAGVPQTLKEIGKFTPAGAKGHIFVGGVDGRLGVLHLIRAGSCDQSSNQPIPDFGVLPVEFIDKTLKNELIKPDPAVKDGALWSPAKIEASPVGLQLFPATTSVTKDNVNDPRPWGRIEKAHGG
jgi:ABC-type sugar transport system substrate-binding protein